MTVSNSLVRSNETHPAAQNMHTSNAVAQSDQQRAIAEVQAAMMIARANPRDQIAAYDRIIVSCQRKSLAECSMYSYNRGGADVSGPSIRLAEAIAQQWGNIQFGIREVDKTEGESIVQAYAWDVETNTRREITFHVPHVRDTKNGPKKLTENRDIYEMVANMGARRLRACILSIIPGDIVDAAVNQCEETLRSSADTSPAELKKMLSSFADIGVSCEQIERRIGRKLEAIQPAQFISLRKIYASLKDGMSEPNQWFETIENTSDKEGKKTKTPKIRNEDNKEVSSDKEPKQVETNNDLFPENDPLA